MTIYSLVVVSISSDCVLAITNSLIIHSVIWFMLASYLNIQFTQQMSHSLI